MDAFVILNIQMTLSLIAYALIAKWHVAPRLAKLPLEASLVPLLWVHVFRYSPLTLFAPGQVSPDIPQDAAATIAYGDLVSGVLALLAIVALRMRLPAAIVLVWLFNVVGIGDVVWATAKGMSVSLYTYPLGWNWYILNFYVPMLIVTHVMITHRLIKRRQPAI